MMRHSRTHVALVGAALMLVACEEDEIAGFPGGGRGSGSAAESGPVTGATATPASADALNPLSDEQKAAVAECTSKQKKYLGIAGDNLVAGRFPTPTGLDRSRVKPFAVYATELTRTVGNVPDLVDASKEVFGEPPPRWYEEPDLGSITLFQAHRIAFDACTTYTATDPRFENAPDNGSAKTACAAMQRAFWSRTPTAIETDACVTVAVVDAAQEPVRARWAYACASVLTAAGFLTY